MSICHIDHIAVTAPDLESGAQFVFRTLGVMPQRGGEHPRMGTHNRLLRLGDALYLEVIAPNPAAPAPTRPRWFGLDHVAAGAPPKLAAWVARTTDIHATEVFSVESLGTITRMSRDDLDWLITIPDDGHPPCDGAAPALIEWHTEVHPATLLEDHGLALVKLELFHPQAERISALLESIRIDGPVAVAPLPAGAEPYLVAHIHTPHGLRTLSAPGANTGVAAA